MELPADVWECILTHGGPLAWAPWVRLCVRQIAARRVQLAYRAHHAWQWRETYRHLWLPTGTPVAVRASRTAPLQLATVVRMSSHTCLQIWGRKATYFFLPHPTARMRVLVSLPQTPS